MSDRVKLAQYFQEAKSFDDDRVARLTASERRAWRVAIGGIVCIVALCCALAALAPLKTVAPPVVIEVDRSTGEVDVVTTINGVKFVPASELEQKYWLWQYVTARESYVWQDRAAYFERVTLMSEAGEQNRYAKAVGADNPKSPQRVLGHNSIIEVKVRSIALGRDGASASVRFTRTTHDLGGGVADQAQSFIATITYSFVETTMSEGDRLINPRGFTVRLYRLDEEMK